jgi:hypothetical protein
VPAARRGSGRSYQVLESWLRLWVMEKYEWI